MSAVRNKTKATTVLSCIRRSARLQAINGSSSLDTVPCPEPGSSMVTTDGSNRSKRVTRAVVKSEDVSAPRRSLRCKTIVNYYEASVRKPSLNKLAVKRKSNDVSSDQPIERKKMISDRSSTSRKTATNRKNSQNQKKVDEIVRKGCKPSNKCSPIDQDKNPESVDGINSSFNDLPVEVIRLIFSYLEPRDRKVSRLVCPLWYDVCEEQFVFKSRYKGDKMTDIRKCLLNSRHQKLNLLFEGTSMNRFPISLWRKVGCKVHYLECRMAAKSMKNIILFCKNLRVLNLNVLLSHQEGSFDLLTTLEELVTDDTINRDLRTLEINLHGDVSSLDNNDLEIWKRVFLTTYKIFPNVVNFAFGRYFFSNHGSIKYNCKFSRGCFVDCTGGPQEDSSVSQSLANLAHAIFIEDEWVKSLIPLSIFRLSQFELMFCKKSYTEADGIAIRNFIASQKCLKSVRLNFSSWVTADMLFFILAGIVDNCVELQTLSINVPPRNHYVSSMPSEWSAIFPKLARIRNLSISGFSIKYAPILATSSPLRTYALSKLELSNVNARMCTYFFSYFTHVRHLTVKKYIKNAELQHIFHHLTMLETLDIHLDSSCTNYGITGCHKQITPSSPKVSDYSIKRLKSLKRLTINFEKAVSVSDRVFLHFRLPNLEFFHCTKDSIKSPFVEALSKRLPLIREIKFTSADMTLETLVKISTRFKNLNHLQTNADRFATKLGQIFKACPQLQLITNLTNTKGRIVEYRAVGSSREVRRYSYN